MNKTIAVFALGASLAAAPAFADKGSSRPEAIGVGMGATVGALAGGPVGFVFGAAIGATIGDKYHRKDQEAHALNEELRATEEHVAALESTVRGLHASLETQRNDLDRLRATDTPNMTDLLQGGIAMDVLFRTGEDELADETRVRIGELAVALSAVPEIRLHLDGYADERGDSAYNQSLSERRARHVRDLLTAHGVGENRITLVAHGESAAADDRSDSFALERKVSLTLLAGDGESLAANPD